jgi:hypothetical protein
MLVVIDSVEATVMVPPLRDELKVMVPFEAIILMQERSDPAPVSARVVTVQSALATSGVRIVATSVARIVLVTLPTRLFKKPST